MKTAITTAILLGSLLFAPLSFAAPVNVNTANAEQIADALKGVGPEKAKAIVDYRKANGPFQTAEQLTEVKGIGPKTVEVNKEDIQL